MCFVTEMGIDMPGNILGTKSTDLGSITLLMVIVTKGRGTKAAGKAMAYTFSVMAIQDVVNGMLACLSTLYLR